MCCSTSFVTGVLPSPCFPNFLARTTFVLKSLPEAKNPGQDAFFVDFVLNSSNSSYYSLLAFRSVCEHLSVLTWLSEHTLNCMIYLLSIWGCGECTISVAVSKRHHHYFLLVPLVALSPVYLRVEVNTLSTSSHVKPRFCLMSSSFGCDGNSWSNDFISLFWIFIQRVPYSWSHLYCSLLRPLSCIHSISTHYSP